MGHNRSRFRVGTWRVALLVTLALTGASVTRAGANIAPIQDPTQSSTETIEIVAPNSTPATGPLAPGIPELVAALPPFTIQHFPPAELLSAPNPANGEDAVQVADKCAEDVPVTPAMVPLPRNSFDAAQDTVNDAKEQFACLKAIEVEEAAETDTIGVPKQTESLPQDLVNLVAVEEPIAEDPTQGAPDVEEIPAPPEVQAAAQEAQAANQEEVVDPGQESGPVFTPLVPEGPGCPEVQEQVLDLREMFTSVEAELRVIELVLQECEQSPSPTATATAQPPSPTATATAKPSAHTATATAKRAAHAATHSPAAAAHRAGDTSQQPAAHHAGHALRRPAAHRAGHRARRPAAHHAGHHAGLQVV
jgi:hypothetical protein